MCVYFIWRILQSLHWNNCIECLIWTVVYFIIENNLSFLHFYSIIVCNCVEIINSSTNSFHLSALIHITLYRLLLLIDAVDPFVLFKSAPILTTYLFPNNNYSALTKHGFAILSVHTRELSLLTTTHPNILGMNINSQANKIEIIYSLRNIRAT